LQLAAHSAIDFAPSPVRLKRASRIGNPFRRRPRTQVSRADTISITGLRGQVGWIFRHDRRPWRALRHWFEPQGILNSRSAATTQRSTMTQEEATFPRPDARFDPR